MQPKKLTPGQQIALGTFLSSYDENHSFKKLLDAVRTDDFEMITIWEQVGYMNTAILAEAIASLSANIDAVKCQ